MSELVVVVVVGSHYTSSRAAFVCVCATKVSSEQIKWMYRSLFDAVYCVLCHCENGKLFFIFLMYPTFSLKPAEMKTLHCQRFLFIVFKDLFNVCIICKTCSICYLQTLRYRFIYINCFTLLHVRVCVCVCIYYYGVSCWC